ncbi:MAG: DUF5605 domain-containing protein [Oscillospiraceae bacterium]|nr:DUF5605 domain-containing protein [Oscillospiraceae bacterium]MCL2279817.1 DUF5605 domain-containing protein [Oscillospiraceae bacterium]
MSNKQTVSRYGVWEISINVKTEEIAKNPFDTRFKGVFKKDNRTQTAHGFYDGAGVFKLRFMPDAEGEWIYRTYSEIPSLDGLSGSFICSAPKPGNHGVARVSGKHFVYDDGAPLYPMGTTCYAWIHQPETLRRQTIESLKNSAFKKIRMCVFPKHYDFNKNEPELFAFEGNLADGFDYSKPNPVFYSHLETCIAQLHEIGIEADLILFHAYDHWGFSQMDRECNHRYLKYLTARLSCFPNIWWSLANEYDLLRHLTEQDWESFAKIIQEGDYAGHLMSIHNCFGFYNHSKPWITHCSIQRQDVYKTTEYTNEWIDEYQKPATLDEIGYEGDIHWGWGNLTAEELMRRSWEAFVRGGYPGHGETYLSSDDVLWWSKGGVLKGDSPARYEFLMKICEEAGGIDYLPERSPWDIAVGGIEGKVYIAYLGFSRPRNRSFHSDHPYLGRSNLPEGKYKVEIIDTWNMTITDCGIMAREDLHVELPARQYMAVRLTVI